MLAVTCYYLGSILVCLQFFNLIKSLLYFISWTGCGLYKTNAFREFTWKNLFSLTADFPFRFNLNSIGSINKGLFYCICKDRPNNFFMKGSLLGQNSCIIEIVFTLKIFLRYLSALFFWLQNISWKYKYIKTKTWLQANALFVNFYRITKLWSRLVIMKCAPILDF